jgi:hypothetical protein
VRRFVDRNSNQPCVEFRIPLKLFELLVRLQERILHHVFSIFAILRDVLSDAKYLALILAHQCVVGRDVPGAHPFNQGYVGMLLVFSCD